MSIILEILIFFENRKIKSEPLFFGSLNVLLLHSNISSEDQKNVFSKTNPHRKVILSTNISETSITIDEVKFVIDSGLTNVDSYDPLSGV